MSSYRNYGDVGSYRPRIGSTSTSSFGRNTSSGNSFGSYRNSYVGVSSRSLRSPTVFRDRISSGIGSSIGSSIGSGVGNSYSTNFTRKYGDRAEEKPSYRYSYTKNAERELTPVRAFREEKQTNSRYFNGSYRSTSSIKSNPKTDKCQLDRPSPSLDRYRGCSSRETSRGPESISSRHDLNSQSESCRGHSVDKMVTEQNSASSRGINGASTIRNPSPDLRTRSPAQRMCSKISTLKRRSESPNPSSPIAMSSQSNGLITNSRRFTPSEENPDKLTTKIGHTESDNFQIQRQQSKTSENIDISEPSIRIQYSKGSIQRSEFKSQGQEDVQNASNAKIENGNHAEDDGEETIVISVVTRGTSPTPPPPLTAFTRTRRLEPIPKPVQREVKKSWFNRIIRRDQILQVDRSDNSFRDRCISRYSSGTRTSSIPWVSSYLDRYSAPVSTPNRTSTTPQRPNSTPSQRDNNNHVHTAPIESPRCTTETSSRSIPIPTLNGGPSNGYKFSAFPSSISKEQHPPSTESNLKSPSDDGSVSEVSYDASLPSAECQDHGQGSTLRRDSLSKSSESSTTTSSSSSQHCKPGNVSRSASLKSRQVKSPEVSATGNLPNSCTNRSSSGSSNSNNGSSSSISICSGSGAVCAGNFGGKPATVTSSAASMTKIKSAGTATTSSNSSVASNISGDGKCASNGNSNSAESSVRSHRASSPDARERKPPVPKSEVATAAKNAATMAAGSAGIRYVNKDFRKSALNMENGDPSRSQITERKLQKKSQRSLSVSSQDSEANSEVAPQVLSSGSSASVRSNKSGSKPGSKSSGSGRSKTNQRNSVKEGSKSLRLGTPKAKSVFKNGSVSTSNCSSSEGSNSEGENDGGKQQSKAKSRRRRSSDSPYQDGGKGKMSRGSSRTSVLGSSADELSINTEKPPRPPSSPRIRSERSANTEEAKSFLMRALGPVTNFFKVKQDDDEGNNGGWIDADSEGNSETVDQVRSAEEQSVLVNHNCNSSRKSPSERKKQLSTKLRHQSSEEKPWWLDPNSDNVPEGVDRNPSVGNDDISQDTTVSSAVLPDDGKFKFKVWRGDSEERAWWLDANDNIPNGETAITTAEPTSTKSCSQLPPASPSSAASLSRKGSYSSASAATTRSNKHQQRRLRHQSSGERAWWMSDDPDSIPDGIEVIAVSDEIRKPPLRHVDSGERPWWLDSSAKVPDGVERLPTPEKIQIGGGSSGTSDSSESFERVEIGRTGSKDGSLGLARFPLEVEALGDRASPEGIENPPRPLDDYDGRSSPYDNVSTPSRTPPKRSAPRKRPANLPLFISTHTNIDDLLGDITGQSHSPHMMRNHQGRDDESDEDEECREIDATQVIIHDSTPQTPVIQRRIRDNDRPQPDGYIPLDDTALQLYKDGDYGAYLDLEASISEQQEEFEGFQSNRKNSIVLRTQLSVRVHTIIEKLLNSEGRELRRALFSLKQIFQEDKDLVHEFVQNDGLACLIKVGSEADQNYQNYILRALGQVMLYVDGMNGVMEHGQTVQWLYTLIASKFRLVVKTALKLLLVFVEYVETNSILLVRAIRSVDTSRGMIPWTNVMKLLQDYDAADTELLIYAMTLVNKCLNGIPDQDTYYDQVDCFEEQGIEGIIQRYMSKPGTDLDLLRQFQIYEAVLHHEDGNDRDSPIRQLDDNIRKTLRNRKSHVDSHERRKSRRHSTGTSPLSMALSSHLSSPRLNHTSLGLSNGGLSNGSSPLIANNNSVDDDDESSSSQSSQSIGDVQMNGSYKENKDVGVTPALRRRRERAERQRSFIREQQEVTANIRASIGHPEENGTCNGVRYTNGTTQFDGRTNGESNKLSRVSSRKDLTPLMNAANKLDSEEKNKLQQQQPPWYGKSPDEGVECDEGNHTDEDEDRRVVLQLKRENTVKDLTQKLTAQNLIPNSPVEEKVSRVGDVSGLISKAKEGLAKSKSKADVVKSPTNESLPKPVEVKKSENELHWEELVNKLKRPLCLCDLDFTDLNSDDEIDVLGPVNVSNGVPPPPPPMAPPGAMNGTRAPPPPPPGCRAPPPLPTVAPPLFGVNLKSTPLTSSFARQQQQQQQQLQQSSPQNGLETPPPKSPVPPPQQQQQQNSTCRKSKKTVKLFWKEVRDDPIILSRLDKNKMIWDELSPIPVDTQKLEHLFESRAKDLITKKQQELNKNKEVIVLDHKRSNAINIGMTKLPPPRSIKTAILKMDATIMNREGIEKLLTMLPTEEERSRIQEAQAANPDLPLGSAEQFLLTLASISELPARLKLWAFKLDFENSEKEIADPLMDLKQGMETLRVNKTFRGILSTLLSIGIFLNGNEVKGFQLEYLAKVPEVKDTVHKHSLLHHLCHMVMEKFPDSTDLYSEIGAVTRASKIDFDELSSNIGKLENECKASWDHLKLIAKHDGSTMMKVKMSDFLADCAERIIVLSIVHRRIVNRFHKFILWLGIPLHRVQDTKPNEFCRIVSEFALEYRTTRERVLQQLEKKANHRERNKTRGKMITEVGKFRTKEDRADAELRQLLGSDISDVESIHGTLPWRRQRKDGRTSLGPLLRDERTNGHLTDGDDELLESLVKTATKTPASRTAPRERKRTRHADLKRSRTRENNTTPEGYRP